MLELIYDPCVQLYIKIKWVLYIFIGLNVFKHSCDKKFRGCLFNSVELNIESLCSSIAHIHIQKRIQRHAHSARMLIKAMYVCLINQNTTSCDELNYRGRPFQCDVINYWHDLKHIHIISFLIYFWQYWFTL